MTKKCGNQSKNDQVQSANLSNFTRCAFKIYTDNEILQISLSWIEVQMKGLYQPNVADPFSLRFLSKLFYSDDGLVTFV